MADCMMFPKDWHDFIKDYSFIDSEQVYTNGSELIQVFRVIQLIEHLLKEQEAVKPRVSMWEQRCGNCNKVIEMDGWITCPWCGKPILWEGR